MIALGIECTAHTFGIGIVEEKSGEIAVRANELSKYPSTGEGYVPRKLVDFHSKNFVKVIKKSLAAAGIGLRDVDAIAYSQGPGIGHCLHFGYTVARTLASFLKKPLVPVSHVVAHVEIGRLLCGLRDPLVVYVSGGNTQIASRTKIRGKYLYKIYGETLDIGLGNFVDRIGRLLELNPPDAVGVLTQAREGKKFLPLPYTVKGMNFSFTGLLTAVGKMRESASAADLCYSAQETSFAMLVEACERALCHTKNSELLLCGGNARNKRLQEMFGVMCEEHGARFGFTPFEHSGDAGAMIAYTGLMMLEHDAVPRSKKPSQRMRLDSQEITW